MNREELRLYLLERPEAWVDYPFGPRVAVFKIRTKMFATLVEDEDLVRMNLKCDPHEAMILRDIFTSVRPGYHMNKRHLNTVIVDCRIPDGEIQRMVDSSYGLVVRGLKGSERKALEVQYGKAALYPAQPAP